MRDADKNFEKECNCRKGAICPLQGKCLAKNLVYQATVLNKSTSKTESYIGLTSTTFKARLANHTASIKNKKYEKSCKLAQHVHNLKDKNIEFNITWKIMCRASTFSPISKVCNLCVNEKMFILHYPNECTLNSRSELTFNCRHRTACLIDKG